jgi:hypothetical protein
VNREIGLGDRYRTRDKLKGLYHFFGDDESTRLDAIVRTIKKSYGHAPDLLITAFDYDRRRARYFRSNKNSLASNNRSKTRTTRLADAVHASTNAPINYFDEPALVDGRRYWDGGISGHNNPVLAATTEWLANHPASDHPVSILSIGTGNVFLPMKDTHPAADPALYVKRTKSTPFNDLNVMATSILDDPPDAASFIAHVMLRQPLTQSVAKPVETGCIVRMNPLIQPVLRPHGHGSKWFAPEIIAGASHANNLRLFKNLLNLDMDAVLQTEVNLITRFAQAWLDDRVPNQSIRSGPDLSPQIGHARFSQALTAWHTLNP